MSERTSQWPSTYVSIHGCFEPQCIDPAPTSDHRFMGRDDDQKDEGNDEEDHQDQEKDDAGVLFVAASESDNPEQSCRPSGKRESVATISSSTSSTIRNSRQIPWLD